MPLRYSKQARKQLRSHAMRRLMLPPSRLDETMPALLRKAVRQMQREMLSKQQAPQSVVDLLLNKERDKDAWLQKPGEHSFNDEMGGDTRYSKLLSKKERTAYSAEEPSRPTLEHLLEERMRNANIGPNSR